MTGSEEIKKNLVSLQDLFIIIISVLLGVTA